MGYIVLKNAVCSDYDRFIKTNIGIESRKFSPCKKSFEDKIEEKANSLYSDKSSYTYCELVDFKREMLRELYEFEFKCFPLN